MLSIPEMIMIGGNSRNSGKTTLACSIIRKLAASHEVIGLKVTSIRPGEEEMHGNHANDITSNYTVFEETDRNSHKDTSKMLTSGATHVYYIRVSDNFLEQAVLHFISTYINRHIIVVCESRSLRNIIIPGIFLMMIRKAEKMEEKEVGNYVSKADEVFYFNDDLIKINQFVDNLRYANGKFLLMG